jgi:hypothetical protein
MDFFMVLKSILHLGSQIQGPLISLGCMYSYSKAHMFRATRFRLRDQSCLFNLGVVPLIVSQSLHEFGMKVK